jgi:arylsulfatase A-like enzyme
MNRSFIYLHFREPHSPYRPPAPYDTLFGPDRPLADIDGWARQVCNGQEVPAAEEIAQLRRLYDGNLAYADANFGAVRQALEEAGLWQRSAVILTADHGEALLEQGFLGHNNALYDTCMRIPLIIRVPGGARGRRVQGLVDLTDLAPTILELMGVPAGDSGMRGVSLTPALEGRAFPGKEYVFSRTTSRHGDYAVRDAHWKYVLESRFGAEHLIALDGGLVERAVENPDPIRLAYYRQILARRMLSLVRPDLPRLRPSRLSTEQREQLQRLGYME